MWFDSESIMCRFTSIHVQQTIIYMYVCTLIYIENSGALQITPCVVLTNLCWFCTEKPIQTNIGLIACRFASICVEQIKFCMYTCTTIHNQKNSAVYINTVYDSFICCCMLLYLYDLNTYNVALSRSQVDPRRCASIVSNFVRKPIVQYVPKRVIHCTSIHDWFNCSYYAFVWTKSM